MFKDKLTTTLIIFCVLVGGVLIFLILLGFTAKPPTQIAPTFLPTPTPVPVQSEINNKISIGSVEVNNFLENPLQTNPSGDALLVDNDTFRIVYIAITNEFLIRVLTQPFEPIRQEAENTFLEKLGVTKEQACQLKVTVFQPINKEAFEDSYRLSFCL